MVNGLLPFFKGLQDVRGNIFPPAALNLVKFLENQTTLQHKRTYEPQWVVDRGYYRQDLRFGLYSPSVLLTDFDEERVAVIVVTNPEHFGGYVRASHSLYILRLRTLRQHLAHRLLAGRVRCK